MRGKDNENWFTPAYGPSDWPEDSGLENGNYQCRCYLCGGRFIGHKRRVVCKTCIIDRRVAATTDPEAA